MKSGAIILARLDSSRLPGKALKRVGDKLLIEHCITKLKTSTLIEPILATSDREIDYPLIEIAKKHSIKYFAGNLNNVANRVLGCIDYFSLDYFARINGDSPFLNIHLLDTSFGEIVKGQYDFGTNLLPRTFPYGVSLEIFNSEIYRNGYKLFKGNSTYEEHITSYFYDNKSNYYYKNFESSFKLSPEESKNFRLVIDTKEDYEIITQMHTLNKNIFEESIENVYQLYKEVIKNKKIKQDL
jgi:spore coat polysaccharide biosynthesis protein SpsF (cytidylyltransferase family)